MESLLFFYPEGHQAHVETGHPERPERVEVLKDALIKVGWWEAFPKISSVPLARDFLETVHTPDYLQRLQRASQAGERLDVNTFTTPPTWCLALQAAGGSVAVATAVWERQVRRGFALTRPAGHHACPDHGMGFCLLNNIAIAAEYLLRYHGARKLAIIDLDLHHGNGTQEFFYRRPEVFFFSIHQSPLYPQTGAIHETGSGAGEGTTANFPLPPASGDQAYQALLDELILPLLNRFQPEMLLISAGFDPHWRDPLGHLRVSVTAYAGLVARLVHWAEQYAGGRIALMLEGGYDLDVMASCGLAVTAVLLDRPWADPLGPSPRPEGKSWQAVIRQAREIWNV